VLPCPAPNRASPKLTGPRHLKTPSGDGAQPLRSCRRAVPGELPHGRIGKQIVIHPDAFRAFADRAAVQKGEEIA